MLHQVKRQFNLSSTGKSLDATHWLKIQRLRCRECGGSHSQSYEFVVPYRRLSQRALEGPVRAYLEDRTTYLGSLNEAVNDPATVFSTVERVLKNLPVAWMKLMTMLIAAGGEVKTVVNVQGCPNSSRCRQSEKKMQLDWAANVLWLFPELFEICSRHGISLFGSRRGCELLRAHRVECGLF